MADRPVYDYQHRKLRAQWQKQIDKVGGWPCARCGIDIPPHAPTAWDLGHDDTDLTQYNGPECASCSRRAGAEKRWAHTTRPRPRSRRW